MPLRGAAVAVGLAGLLCGCTTGSGHGGARLFDWRFAPVILEGFLTGTVDTEAVQHVPRVERDRKAVQLQLTTEKATHELVKDLLKEAKSGAHS